MEIEDLFDEHGALSFDKQLRLAELVGESAWRFDMDRGLLIFDRFTAAVQILGTVSDYSHTWLWAWANEASKIPPALLKATELIRSFGQTNHVVELTEPELHVEPFEQGHVLAMVAVGIIGAAAYYRAPYEGGAAFLAISELPDAEDTRPLSLRIVSNFTSFIAAHECDHRVAFESYVRAKGFSCRPSENRGITAEMAGVAPIRARFDTQDRLVRLDAQIGGSLQAKPAPWWKFWSRDRPSNSA